MMTASRRSWPSRSRRWRRVRPPRIRVTRARLPRDLAGKVTVDGMYAHLRKLQEIADANGGSRAEGTPGYDASVDYVAQTLRTRVLTCRPRSSSGSIAPKAATRR